MKHILALSSALLALTAAGLAKTGWTDNYEKGLEQAKKEKKLVLVDFTGSDWCGWCIKLDKEVFAEAKFKEYAKQNLVLIEVDFPQLKKLSRPKQKKNDELKTQYGVTGFPSVFILDSEGNKLGKLGYRPGGAEGFIAEIEKLKGGTSTAPASPPAAN